MTAARGRSGQLAVLRALFTAAVLATAVAAIASRKTEITETLGDLPPETVAAALFVAVLYMLVTMLIWRSVLQDLGSRLSLGAAARLFFVSQLAKYLPGGMWGIVAVSEMGMADHQIPRRRSLSAMFVATLISIATGLAVAAAALPFAPAELSQQLEWFFWLIPLVAIALVPKVLNQLLDRGLRLLRRPPLEHPVTFSGVATAASWSLLAWLLVGAHVATLGIGVGMDYQVSTIALVAGTYALAWTVGFLVLVVPAGVGVREAVLVAALASQLDAGAAVVVAVGSRAILTMVDLLLGGLALAAVRRS